MYRYMAKATFRDQIFNIMHIKCIFLLEWYHEIKTVRHFDCQILEFRCLFMQVFINL